MKAKVEIPAVKMSRTEQLFQEEGGDQLETFIEKRIYKMMYEPLTLKSGDIKYTPDFLVVFEDGSFVFVEVKASKFQKDYAYSRTRVRAMAAAYPFFSFVEALKAKGNEWALSYIGKAGNDNTV